MNKFIIIVPVWNSEKYIENCLLSILSQKYRNFDLIVIDDGSTDKTTEIIKTINANATKKFITHKNPKNLISPLRSFIKGTTLSPNNPEDILVTVDGDDWLAHDKVLTHLDKIYQNKNIHLTYGQFEPLSHTYHDFCKPLKDTRKYRKTNWTTSHLRTFKRKIFDLIKDKDLRDHNNNYYRTAGDLALMYPAVEMCGIKRIKFIPDILYIYNDLNPACHMTIYEKEQLRTAKEIKRKPQYKELKVI